MNFMLYARTVQPFLLIGLAVALLAGCGTPVLVRPSLPAPPPWVMQDCPAWPTLPGTGRVEIEAASQAVRDARVAHADCQARLQGAQGYIRALTK